MKKCMQVSVEEREKYISSSAVFTQLDRHQGTISNEIKRDKSSDIGYLAARSNNIRLKVQKQIAS